MPDSQSRCPKCHQLSLVNDPENPEVWDCIIHGCNTSVTKPCPKPAAPGSDFRFSPEQEALVNEKYGMDIGYQQAMNKMSMEMAVARNKAIEKYHELRFQAACSALSGLCSHPELGNLGYEDAAGTAVKQAEALLTALGITKPE